MNGLKRLLAMALAMLLLILPAAMAEENTATAHTLTISNIAVNAAGVDLLDLEGLSVEMTAADTGDAVEFVLRLLGGEDDAAEGYALFDGRELVLGADGLSSAYALPLEKMMGDDIAPALQLFAEMLSEDTLIGLVNAVAAPFVSLAENAMPRRWTRACRRSTTRWARSRCRAIRTPSPGICSGNSRKALKWA